MPKLTKEGRGQEVTDGGEGAGSVVEKGSDTIKGRCDRAAVKI